MPATRTNHDERAIQETAQELVSDADRLRDIELEKASLEPDDPRRVALARESAALTALMTTKARFELGAVEGARAASLGEPPEEPPTQI